MIDSPTKSPKNRVSEKPLQIDLKEMKDDISSPKKIPDSPGRSTVYRNTDSPEKTKGFRMNDSPEKSIQKSEVPDDKSNRLSTETGEHLNNVLYSINFRKTLKTFLEKELLFR